MMEIKKRSPHYHRLDDYELRFHLSEAQKLSKLPGPRQCSLASSSLTLSATESTTAKISYAKTTAQANHGHGFLLALLVAPWMFFPINRRLSVNCVFVWVICGLLAAGILTGCSAPHVSTPSSTTGTSIPTGSQVLTITATGAGSTQSTSVTVDLGS